MATESEEGAPGSAWERSRRKRAEVALIAAAGTPLIRLMASTWRWRVEGDAEAEGAGDHVESTPPHGIYACWHGRILPGLVHFSHRGMVVITSANFDGEWIARILHRFGYGTARGSTSRGARKALRRLVRVAATHPTAFTVDGPRGPARVAQPGAVWLAKTTGHPVIPFHAEARSHWTLASWDRTQIPKPFTTVALVVGAPFVVPRDTDDAGLERYRVRLEADLASLERRCLALVGAGAATGPASRPDIS